MNTLKIKVVNGAANYAFIKIDGKDVKLKKSKNGSHEITYTTEAPTAHISVQTFMEIRGKLWWLTSLFYFFISIFGIFDRHSNFKCLAIAYEAELPLQAETRATLRLLRWRDGEKAVALDGAEARETENKCFVDKEAKKRRVIMRIVKIVIAAAAVIVGALLLINGIN